MSRLEDELRQRVLSQIDLSQTIEDEQIKTYVRREIRSLGRNVPIGIEERKALERRVFNSLRKLDILQELLENDDITEIMINGPKDIFVEEKGQIRKLDKTFSTGERLHDVIQQIAAQNNEIVNETHPILDTKVDGTRVCIVMNPVSLEHPIVSIRKFPKEPITIEKLISYGSISPEIAEFLKKAVVSRYNIFISGGTSSGKTTFLNALTEYVPADQRVITIEDSAELQIMGIPNLVRLESRNATLEGKLEVTIRDLVKTSLRLRPDRIIVGECRGGEALEMLQAMGTGHPGSISTGHANSAKDMVSRLETMVLMAGGVELPLDAIRKQISSGIDLIIQLGRLKDRSRRLLEICEVVGMEDGEVKLNSLYRLDQENGMIWKKTGQLIHTEKMDIQGFSDY
ncbi:MAG TPA: pilus assembly protein [Lachnospiraceae bacterium]|jgi:pilus assembly protein CpaF|nr:CpaF family protein [Lachnospiraceae bacterium]MEE3357143.1 CpaF family protein [Lachnospiraceae bacterium]HAN50648.1 pilus assembly protein [Lachnospiraceae bacterium]HBE08312.1 pilus assembly protein [Lachnospiraceae bacterium]